MSEPKAKVDPSWDSPSGLVYTWRWDLGRAATAFYGALVLKKPTWVSWEVLPFVLGFAMERRDPEDLYADGLMSHDAIRIVGAFEGTSGVLSTKELRQKAGFPTGKPQRAAYLKAVEELDSRLLLAKTFDTEGEGDEMSHALVSIKYEVQVNHAKSVTVVEALQAFLLRYLPQAVLVDTKVLAKHLRLQPAIMNAAAEATVWSGAAIRYGDVLVATISEH